VGTSAYAARKGGLDALMQVVAREVGPDRIRTSSIYPGVIDTPMYRRLGNDDPALACFLAITPLRGAGQPADVGDVAVWLLGEKARFVTVQSLMVDGGFTLASGLS
jgi:NAD(P)-dependent dehydrogenase (short-subunit alcohol dehydrogenase family)